LQGHVFLKGENWSFLAVCCNAERGPCFQRSLHPIRWAVNETQCLQYLHQMTICFRELYMTHSANLL